MIFGYIVTAIVALAFTGLIAAIFLGRGDLRKALAPYVNIYSVLALAALVAFFVIFSILFVSPVEQLYFDENIYQGIALNILHNGNAVWCQYGTAYLASGCPYSVIYHDPVGWSLFIAMAFAIFGVGTQTAYNLQLLVGALSIIGVFLLSAVLFRRKDVPVLAAAFMALNPQLFVWSRTQAVADLPFMMLTVFAFFFFVVYVRRRNRITLAMAMFSVTLTVYTRIEAFMIVPILLLMYFLFGDKGIASNARRRAAEFLKDANNMRFLLLIALLIILLLPQLFYIILQAKTGSYGQGSGSALFSFSNFNSNFYPNLKFLLGMLNYTYYYPVVFPFEITLAAALGVVLFAILGKARKDRFAVLLLLGLWIIAYYLFYDFFYAGSALYGVDVRFMLQILAPLAILAGLGVAELAALVVVVLRRVFRNDMTIYLSYLFMGVLFVALAAYPFVALEPYFTIKPQQMPQQGKILQAVGFIYGNYTEVPASCLVFSFTPDLWYTLGRSSAQIGYLGSSNATFVNFTKGYSCFVIDYGYWCQVPPYAGTTCTTMLHDYSIVPLAKTNNSTGTSLGLYRILNYTT